MKRKWVFINIIFVLLLLLHPLYINWLLTTISIRFFHPEISIAFRLLYLSALCILFALASNEMRRVKKGSLLFQTALDFFARVAFPFIFGVIMICMNRLVSDTAYLVLIFFLFGVTQYLDWK